MLQVQQCDLEREARPPPFRDLLGGHPPRPGGLRLRPVGRGRLWRPAGALGAVWITIELFWGPHLRIDAGGNIYIICKYMYSI